MDRLTVNTLWVGSPKLTPVERFCLWSWVMQGHRVVLHTYRQLTGVPFGVEQRNAVEVLPSAAIFRYGKKTGQYRGGYGAFANLFRYALLEFPGGWWVDTDVVALQPLTELDKRPYVFGWQGNGLVCNAVMKLPPACPLGHRLREYAEKAGKNPKHGQTGPALLTKLIKRLGLTEHVLQKRVLYPYGPDQWRRAWCSGGTVPGPDSYTLHLWNEKLRQAKWNKGKRYPADSVYEQLRKRYAYHEQEESDGPG